MAKRSAILFSSEEYLNAEKTPYCHADRKLLFQTLTESCDYVEENVYSVALTKEDQDQRAIVMAKIQEVTAKLQTDDSLLFYYAGHGVSVKNEPYLILPKTDPDNLEKTAIALRDISNELRIEGVKCFRIFDSCHSGFDVRDARINGDTLMRGVLGSLPDGWVTIAGCAPDEYCYSSHEEGHGVFTSRLVEAIKEIQEGKDVRPEPLKVRTCELVEEWCAESDHYQTPTLIAAVRGNISLATRRPPIKPPQEAITMPVNLQTAEEVKARLIELQGDVPPRSKTYWERYEQIRDSLQKQLCGSRDLVKDYADFLGDITVNRVDSFKASLEEGVVDLVHKKGWRSLHRIVKEVTVERPPLSATLTYGLFGYGRNFRNVDRELGQDYDQPKSVVFAELKPDGTIPGMRIIHYVCPLQTRFLLYTRIEITGVMVKGRTRSHGWYRCVATNDLDATKKHALFVIKKAREMFLRACETNIAYLESEQSV